MSKVLALTIKNRKIVLFLAMLTMLLGAYRYSVTPKQKSPDLSAPNVLLTTVLPGASAQEVDRLVSQPLEQELASLEEYAHSQSFSRDNVSVIVLYLEQETDPQKAYPKVREKVQAAQRQLPKQVQPTQVNTDLVSTAGLILSLRGEQASNAQLVEQAQKIQNALDEVQGVSKTEIQGEEKTQVSIIADLPKLSAAGLTVERLHQILQARSVELPVGELSAGEKRQSVRFLTSLKSLSDIETILLGVNPADGQPLYLKQLATVRLEKTPNEHRFTREGESAVLLSAYFNDNQNVVEVGQRVKQTLERSQAELPAGIQSDWVSFQPDEVKGLVNDFTASLLQGVGLVVLVVLIGMGLRNALVVSAAIPLSILAAIACMSLLGVKIHQISITALIISLGMLVDNAIVVSDAIQHRLDSGQEKLRACIEGTREIALPVLTSTLTTVAAFSPLLLLGSLAGKYIQSIPQTIILSLLLSYVVAILVTPVLAYLLFQRSSKKISSSRIRQGFESTLRFFMKRRLLLLAVIALSVGASYWMFQGLSLEFFPKDDGNTLYIDLTNDQKNDFASTEQKLARVESILKEEPNVVTYTSAAGGGLPKFYIAMSPYVPSPDFAQTMLEIDLKAGSKYKNNRAYADHLQKRLDADLPEAKAMVRELEQAYPTPYPVVVRVSGSQVEEVQKAAQRIQALLEKSSAAIDVKTDSQPLSTELVYEIDDLAAAKAGLSRYEIQNQVSIALMGRESAVLQQGQREIPVVLRADLKNQSALEAMPVASVQNPQPVALSALARLEKGERLSELRRYDGRYNISITSNVQTGSDPVRLQNALEEQLQTESFPNVTITFDGERERIQENFSQMGTSGVLAAVLIFAVLLFEFGSFLQPLIILLTIPLSAVGSLLGLYITGQPLSFMALFGMVSLMGIVVNNAIILVDYINVRRKEKGMDLSEACVDAVHARFRPIMLTTVTTVIGLVPLLLSGSDLFMPMSITLMSGLIVSTLLTLIVIPVVYYTAMKPLERRRGSEIE